VDLSDRPDWDRRVLLAVRQLAYGETASYGSIARRIGAPRAARAVGGAMGRNPLTLIVPCHRVIAADGTLGGYGGDGPFEQHDSLARKRELLLREGVTVAERRR
jgi:methylated-DNA-[protein]-cysteine S-methyltransferase